ncbi:hypothetical protein NQ318_015286 [Aromia moschata]|uniref:DDE-1 domain-containing protein n=1 Tax=Aromia moschata TaxID=1265417 RepID=A0AAV8XE70_9CUCU|nr:hypothetical protein NQ318_015286 [Aromia moschata]
MFNKNNSRYWARENPHLFRQGAFQERFGVNVWMGVGERLNIIYSTMPKFKGRNTNRGNWSQESMKKACDAVISGKMGLRQAAVTYSVPKSSLFDKVNALRSGQEVTLDAKLGRFTQTFNSEHETALVDHVKDLSSRLMPLSRKEFLQLTFQLAEKLKIPHRFSKTKKMAGKDFYQAFMSRHPDLSLRTPESTSLMRCVGFNRPQVERFFNGLSLLMEKFKFQPYNIYNCDETAASTVQKHAKVLSEKGQRQVGKITSDERGKNVTILFCMSAGGQFIPPFFVYPRQRINERLKIGKPSESVLEAQPNGWMNADLFLEWMGHFIKYANPSKERPVLLVLDGHASHKDLRVITFAREHNIHMISTPPHTTHKLQPLDRTFMKPFKDAYYEACGLWMRKNPGARITEYEIAGLVNTAFTKVSRNAIAQKGFECTGIVPFNAQIFDDLDFMSSEMTNIAIYNVQPANSSAQASTVENNENENTLKVYHLLHHVLRVHIIHHHTIHHHTIHHHIIPHHIVPHHIIPQHQIILDQTVCRYIVQVHIKHHQNIHNHMIVDTMS